MADIPPSVRTARTRAPAGRMRCLLAGWALVAAHVVHGLTPADTDSEGWAGLVGGLTLLAATCAAVYGLHRGRHWARLVLAASGLAAAAGFVVYHAAPWRSPITNPYLGEGVGAAAWASVALAVAVGLWAGREGLRRPSAEPTGVSDQL